jgi:hypothetical protein
MLINSTADMKGTEIWKDEISQNMKKEKWK